MKTVVRLTQHCCLILLSASLWTWTIPPSQKFCTIVGALDHTTQVLFNSLSTVVFENEHQISDTLVSCSSTYAVMNGWKKGPLSLLTKANKAELIFDFNSNGSVICDPQWHSWVLESKFRKCEISQHLRWWPNFQNQGTYQCGIWKQETSFIPNQSNYARDMVQLVALPICTGSADPYSQSPDGSTLEQSYVPLRVMSVMLLINTKICMQYYC